LICQSEAVVDDDTKVERTTALQDLVQLRRPPFEAEPVLMRFGFWGSDEGLVTLNRSDALRLLDRFQQASLTALECQHWAQTLEMRDDLSLEPGAEDLLTQFLFEIATPEINEPISPQLVRRWQANLKDSLSRQPQQHGVK
jgi:hypothetical protein